MYCENCGKPVGDNDKFCTNCGHTVAEEERSSQNPRTREIILPQKRKKRKTVQKGWMPVLLLAALILVILVASVLLGKAAGASHKKVLEAYKEFYREYYDKNTGGLGNEDFERLGLDCAGRIIWGPNDQLLMTIVDITYVDEEGIEGTEDIHLYTYEKGKVVQLAEMYNLQTSEYSGYSQFLTVDNVLYYFPDPSEPFKRFGEEVDGNSDKMWVYYLNEKNEFVEMDANLYSNDTEIAEKAFRLYYLSGSSLGGDEGDRFFTANSIYYISGRDFETVIDAMISEKPESQSELQMLYGNMLAKINLGEYYQAILGSEINIEAFEVEPGSLVGILEADPYIYGIKLNGEAVLLAVSRLNELGETLELPREVDGYTVTEIGPFVFHDADNLKTIKLPDSITSIEHLAFVSDTLESLEIPASVKDFGRQIVVGNVTIYCEKGSAIYNYAIENDIPYEIGTIDSAWKNK